MAPVLQRGISLLSALFQFPYLLIDLIDPVLDGVEDPELKMTDLVGVVHHPDDLYGKKKEPDLQRDEGRQEVGGDLKDKESEDDNEKTQIDQFLPPDGL